MVEVMIKQDVFPDSLKNTPLFYVNSYMNSALCKMLSDRLSERALKADCPYVGADVSYGQYIYAKTKGQEDKVAAGLVKLHEEDASFTYG